jgi:hypothetical protein
MLNMLDNVAQALRTTRGRDFEDIVEKILNSFLLDDDIVGYSQKVWK